MPSSYNYKCSNKLNGLSLRNTRYLSSLFYVAPSGIAGVGVFSRLALSSGTYMGEYEGPKANDLDLALSPYTFEANNKVRDGRTLLRFLNHDGKNPNAEFDGFYMYATRDINAGEEITFNYGMPMRGNLMSQVRVGALRRFYKAYSL